MDLSKLTNPQKETFAILLSEGFDYNPSFEASIFYGNDIQNAKDYARTRSKPSKESMRITVVCRAESMNLSFEMTTSSFLVFCTPSKVRWHILDGASPLRSSNNAFQIIIKSTKSIYKT